MPKNNIFYDKHAKLKSRLFIISLVMVFVSFGTGLGILKLSNLKTIGMGVESIYQDRLKPMRQLKSISDRYRIAVVDAANKVLNNTMSWHEGRKSLEDATKRIPDLWNGYLSTYISDEERKTVYELQLLFKTADEAFIKLASIFLNENHYELAKFVKKDLYPSIEPVTNKIDELFQMQISIVKDINDKERLRYRFGLNVGNGSIAVSIILIILVLLQWGRFRSLLDSL